MRRFSFYAWSQIRQWGLAAIYLGALSACTPQEEARSAGSRHVEAGKRRTYSRGAKFESLVFAGDTSFVPLLPNGSSEVCFNGRDDDGNGRIDDGCTQIVSSFVLVMSWEGLSRDWDFALIPPQAQAKHTETGEFVKDDNGRLYDNRAYSPIRKSYLLQNAEGELPAPPPQGKYRIIIRRRLPFAVASASPPVLSLQALGKSFELEVKLEEGETYREYSFEILAPKDKN